VETALDAELRAESAIGVGGRAHLRAQARALDVAERLGDPVIVSRAAVAYLELRQAYGLAGTNREPLDPFAAFVAGLSSPSLGDPENP